MILEVQITFKTPEMWGAMLDGWTYKDEHTVFRSDLELKEACAKAYQLYASLVAQVLDADEEADDEGRALWRTRSDPDWGQGGG